MKGSWCVDTTANQAAAALNAVKATKKAGQSRTRATARLSHATRFSRQPMLLEL